MSNHLGQLLNLATYPNPKKTKKGYTKAKQENWFHTQESAYFSNLNCSIVEGTLVRLLIDLIDNNPREIISTRLYDEERTVISHKINLDTRMQHEFKLYISKVQKITCKNLLTPNT